MLYIFVNSLLSHCLMKRSNVSLGVASFVEQEVRNIIIIKDKSKIVLFMRIPRLFLESYLPVLMSKNIIISNLIIPHVNRLKIVYIVEKYERFFEMNCSCIKETHT